MWCPSYHQETSHRTFSNLRHHLSQVRCGVTRIPIQKNVVNLFQLSESPVFQKPKEIPKVAQVDKTSQNSMFNPQAGWCLRHAKFRVEMTRFVWWLHRFTVILCFQLILKVVDIPEGTIRSSFATQIEIPILKPTAHKDDSKACFDKAFEDHPQTHGIMWKIAGDRQHYWRYWILSKIPHSRHPGFWILGDGSAGGTMMAGSITSVEY